MNRRVLLIIFAAFMSGCTMGPDYERPETVIPEAFEQATDDGPSIANLDWWELFGDSGFTLTQQRSILKPSSKSSEGILAATGLKEAF